MALSKLVDKSKDGKHLQVMGGAIFNSLSSQVSILVLAKKILAHIMQFRRIATAKKTCADSYCEPCFAPHLNKIIAAITIEQPISFLLPAFPAKSPNLSKVLGVLPDMAEQLSLEFLNTLCREIKAIYPPGAQIIICSDGRVFNDVVGIPDRHVSHYQHALSQMIQDLSHLKVFNLDNLYEVSSFADMRTQLMMHHGESLEEVKDAVRRGANLESSVDDEEVNRQYRGITRFLVEDATHPNQTCTRSAIQKDCRARAYIVIQRSRAWGELLTNYFPDAVRLSIHPQSCGSSKLGIKMLDADTWMTPWHGVAIDIKGNFILAKRVVAEALGAVLIYKNNLPSHYVLSDEGTCLTVGGSYAK